MKYSVLRCAAEGEDLRVVQGDFVNRGLALREAKRLRAEQVKAAGSWADRFFVALLEEV